jgi:putative two-component system response regulator
VCRQLKAQADTARIPVIFITALSDGQDEALGFASGAVDYIVKPVRAPVVRARVRNHLSLVKLDELRSTRLQIVQRLGRAAEYRDNETGMHVIRMSHYAKTLAVAAGCTDEWADDLLNAAPMHDVGKIGTPDRVLFSPTRLDREDWEIMKSHAATGADIIMHSDIPQREQIALAVRHHHEHFDGSGYPDGLAGEDIPLHARIISLADSYDALGDARPYHPALPHAEIMRILNREAGSKCDPGLLRVFGELIEDSPLRVP